jgi:hypothetical protein
MYIRDTAAFLTYASAPHLAHYTLMMSGAQVANRLGLNGIINISMKPNRSMFIVTRCASPSQSALEVTQPTSISSTSSLSPTSPPFSSSPLSSSFSPSQLSSPVPSETPSLPDSAGGRTRRRRPRGGRRHNRKRDPAKSSTTSDRPRMPIPPLSEDQCQDLIQAVQQPRADSSRDNRVTATGRHQDEGLHPRAARRRGESSRKSYADIVREPRENTTDTPPSTPGATTPVIDHSPPITRVPLIDTSSPPLDWAAEDSD